MSAPPILVITDLVPGDAVEAACAISTTARGTLDGAPVAVLVADRGALTTGGDDALRPLLSGGVREIRLLPSCDDPEGETRLAAALDALAPGVPRIADHTGGRLVLEDFGALTADILGNGLGWSDRADPTVERPDRLHGPLDAQLGERLAASWATCTSAFADLGRQPPERARHLRIEGAGLFDDAMSPRRVAQALVRGPMSVRMIALSGDHPSAVRRAAELALRLALERPLEPAPTLVVDGARVDAAELLGTLPVADRREDDQLRRTVFSALSRMPPELRDAATPRAEAALGPARGWVAGFRRFREQGMPWITVVPTWQCELRCKYCAIVKQDGRVMPEDVVDGALDMLFASEGDDVTVHFFGGEPILNWPAVQRFVTEGERRARAEGRRVHFQLTSNGYSLTEEMLDWLAPYDVGFELSLDGDAETMAVFRRGRDKGADTYARSVAHHAGWFHSRGLPHTVIQVVHPDNVHRMADNFRHLLELGYRTLQVNYAIGPHWDEAAARGWADGLFAIGAELERRWAAGDDVTLINLFETLRVFRAHLHPTIDWDGTVYAGMQFLYMEKKKPAFRLGHLDDGAAFDRYVVDGMATEDVIAEWTLKGTPAETRRVGAIQKSFVRWMRERHPERLPSEATPLGATAKARERERGEAVEA